MFAKRLLVGFLTGSLVGFLVALVWTRVLHHPFGAAAAVEAYLVAAVTGLLTGLVTGKPIWHQTGKIEAGLKAFFGQLLALGLLFVLRRFVPGTIDLSVINGGVGLPGHLPYVALPAIAGLLGAFFSVDNTDDDEDGKEARPTRVSSEKGARVADSAAEEDDEEAPAKQKRRS